MEPITSKTGVSFVSEYRSTLVAASFEIYSRHGQQDRVLMDYEIAILPSSTGFDISNSFAPVSRKKPEIINVPYLEILLRFEIEQVFNPSRGCAQVFLFYSTRNT